MTNFLIPAFSGFFYYLGILIEHAKRNWFIGIRTPWTLSRDEVWEDTHRIGGRLFKGSALVALLGLFVPTYGLAFVMLPILFSAFYTTFYSYFRYRKTEPPPRNNDESEDA
jgi:uncharacterized membrane protein